MNGFWFKVNRKKIFALFSWQIEKKFSLEKKLTKYWNVR